MLCWSQRSSFHVGPLRRVRRYRDGRQRLNGNRHPRHSTMRDPTSFSPAQRQLQECQGALLCLSLPFPSVYALYTTLATLPTPRHPPFRTPSPPTPSTKSAHRHQPVISQAIRHPPDHSPSPTLLSKLVCVLSPLHILLLCFITFAFILFVFCSLPLSVSYVYASWTLRLPSKNLLSSGLLTAYRTLDLHLCFVACILS